MDSDLAEAISALKSIFQSRFLPADFRKGDAGRIDELTKELELPPRYRAFLLNANPVSVETDCPVEKVKLFSTDEILDENEGFTVDDEGEPDPSWRKNWLAIGVSSLLGDPYFLDVNDLDAEGDCPVYTAMSGTDRWEKRLCASTFAQFLRILATSMEVAEGFGTTIMDPDDENAFREALGTKIRVIDGAAARAGHWSLRRLASTRRSALAAGPASCSAAGRHRDGNTIWAKTGDARSKSRSHRLLGLSFG